MTHPEWLDRIDAYDALSDEQRLLVEQHAAGCADCSAALAAVRSMLDAARHLPRAVPPARDLWPRLVANLEHRSERRRLQPLLVRAAAVIVALGGATWLVFGLGRVTQHAEDAPMIQDVALPSLHSGLALQCMGAGQSLQAALRLADDAPEISTELVVGLAILDRSIDETCAALAAAPEDPALASLLTQRYQQKLALLQAALLRVETT